MKKASVTIILSAALLLSPLAAGQAGSNTLDAELLKAAYGGELTKVQQLLQQGANIDAKEDNGLTVLLYAIHSMNAELVKLLVDKGANIEAKDNEGNTALMLAVKVEVLKLLLLKPEDKGNYALMVNLRAAEDRNAEMLKLLLAKGANIEARDKQGWTALIEAVDMGRTAMAGLLLDHGANIEAKGNDGWTALHWAINEGHPDAAKLLQDRGAR